MRNVFCGKHDFKKTETVANTMFKIFIPDISIMSLLILLSEHNAHKNSVGLVGQT